MDDVKRLIDRLLETEFLIDTVESITNQLSISRNDLLQILEDNSYRDYFQFLRPSKKRHQIPEKIALTIDLFCCTHYAQQCRNDSCPFLHLCPYHIRPMYDQCKNKNCQYDQEILKSIHNRKIIDARGLSFLPESTLYQITRASANPNRSFWACTDHGKKGGCPKKTQCDKLHYCYYALTDACTKPYCQHVINDACVAYFRRKELSEHDHDDVLGAFRKVLQQRKSDYVTTLNIPYHSSSTVSNGKASSSNSKQRKPTIDQQHHRSSSSQRSTSKASALIISSNHDILPFKPDPDTPIPERDQDIILLDSPDPDVNIQVENYVSNEIGCPIKLIISKHVLSKKKESQSATSCSQPIYYYCPTTKRTDIFQLLRWQNEQKHLVAPLVVYASVRDAHDATEQNLETNQFCIFRVQLLDPSIIDGTLEPTDCLQLNHSSTMCFDRMWIYIFNL